MKTHTYTLQLETSKEEAFDFLSRVENLPKWAPLFATEVTPVFDGYYILKTVAGEILFKIDADPMSGVVDMYGGLSADKMTFWPARVVDRPYGKSLLIFTIFQFPEMSECEFDAQCRVISHDLPNIKRELECPRELKIATGSPR